MAAIRIDSRALGWTACFLNIALAGCGGSPPAAGTGAEPVARGYYEAIVRKEWEQAYAALHPDSRAKASATQFARKAESFRRQLGFEPEEVSVRSCEEHGSEAIAHVVLKGGGRSYKDAIVLRKAQATWAVVPPPRFGEQR